MLSVIIPSYKDPLLNKTIESMLKSAHGDIEIIAVLDGYTQNVYEDEKVKVMSVPENKGMRNAINEGVKSAQGDILMRSDEHCIYSDGFDLEIARSLDNMSIMVPRRYFLNPETWSVMDIPYIDYEKLVIADKGDYKKFAAVRWESRTEARKMIDIDETMAYQGSCWFMKKSLWDACIKELQSEGYGTHYQDSTEMMMKVWQYGGRIMLNKRCWYAHRHRSFPRTHSYGGDDARRGFQYALDTWGEYYEKVIIPRFFKEG